VCDKLAHEERLSTSTQLTRLRQLPRNIIEEFNIWSAIEEMSQSSFSQPKESHTNRRSIFRHQSGGSQEFPTLDASTGVLTSNTDGSDTPLITHSLSQAKSQSSQTECCVIFRDEEVPIGMPAGLSKSNTDGSDIPLTF